MSSESPALQADSFLMEINLSCPLDIVLELGRDRGKGEWYVPCHLFIC